MPKQFKSSRSNRQKVVQRAEDFMDEEDLRELESSKEIVTKEQFSGLGSTEQDLLKRREAALLKRPSYAYFRLGHNAKS